MESLQNLPFNFSSLSVEPLPPALSSIYLWDVCKSGRLFFPESYDIKTVENWMIGIARKAMSSVILPDRFNRNKITELLTKKILESFERSEFRRLFSSVDTKNIRSLNELLKESLEKGKSGFEKIISFLKQNEFPPILWLELERYNLLSAQVMNYLSEKIIKLITLRPRSKGEIFRRSKQTWAMAKYYGKLSTSLTEAFLEVFRTFLFLECWSCEKEEELFGEVPWTFKNIDISTFEEVIFQLHSSIDKLAIDFMAFESFKTRINFSEPIGWAFKQLMQIA